jgi:hypothetical protein
MSERRPGQHEDTRIPSERGESGAEDPIPTGVWTGTEEPGLASQEPAGEGERAGREPGEPGRRRAGSEPREAERYEYRRALGAGGLGEVRLYRDRVIDSAGVRPDRDSARRSSRPTVTAAWRTPAPDRRTLIDCYARPPYHQSSVHCARPYELRSYSLRSGGHRRSALGWHPVASRTPSTITAQPRLCAVYPATGAPRDAAVSSHRRPLCRSSRLPMDLAFFQSVDLPIGWLPIG